MKPDILHIEETNGIDRFKPGYDQEYKRMILNCQLLQTPRVLRFIVVLRVLYELIFKLPSLSMYVTDFTVIMKIYFKTRNPGYGQLTAHNYDWKSFHDVNKIHKPVPKSLRTLLCFEHFFC